jgi:hypothetical protein
VENNSGFFRSLLKKPELFSKEDLMAVSKTSYENHIFSKTYCEVISKLISIKFSPLKIAYYILIRCYED